MPTYTEMTENLGKKIVDAVTNAEDNAIIAVGKANKFAARMQTRFAGKLPAALTAKLPSARRFENLPTAKDVVAANTALLKRLVDAQSSFALKVIDAVRPDATVAEPTPARQTPAPVAAAAVAPAAVIAESSVTTKPVAKAPRTIKTPVAIDEGAAATTAALKPAVKPAARKAVTPQAQGLTQSPAES